MTLIESIKLGEGLHLKPYRCTEGKLTIGYGRNLEDGISEEEAEILLMHDIEDATSDAKTLPYFETLNQTRKDVLIEMVINMGLGRVSQFKKMFMALGNGDYETASKEMLDSKWHKQVGNRAKRLAEKMRIG